MIIYRIHNGAMSQLVFPPAKRAYNQQSLNYNVHFLSLQLVLP